MCGGTRGWVKSGAPPNGLRDLGVLKRLTLIDTGVACALRSLDREKDAKGLSADRLIPAPRPGTVGRYDAIPDGVAGRDEGPGEVDLVLPDDGALGTGTEVTAESATSKSSENFACA